MLKGKADKKVCRFVRRAVLVSKVQINKPGGSLCLFLRVALRLPARDLFNMALYYNRLNLMDAFFVDATVTSMVDAWRRTPDSTMSI